MVRGLLAELSLSWSNQHSSRNTGQFPSVPSSSLQHPPRPKCYSQPSCSHCSCRPSTAAAITWILIAASVSVSQTSIMSSTFHKGCQTELIHDANGYKHRWPLQILPEVPGKCLSFPTGARPLIRLGKKKKNSAEWGKEIVVPSSATDQLGSGARTAESQENTYTHTHTPRTKSPSLLQFSSWRQVALSVLWAPHKVLVQAWCWLPMSLRGEEILLSFLSFALT